MGLSCKCSLQNQSIEGINLGNFQWRSRETMWNYKKLCIPYLAITLSMFKAMVNLHGNSPGASSSDHHEWGIPINWVYYIHINCIYIYIICTYPTVPRTKEYWSIKLKMFLQVEGFQLEQTIDSVARELPTNSNGYIIILIFPWLKWP